MTLEDRRTASREATAATTKIDFRRELRGLYTAGREPTLVQVPPLSFLMIDGHGDPSD